MGPAACRVSKSRQGLTVKRSSAAAGVSAPAAAFAITIPTPEFWSHPAVGVTSRAVVNIAARA